MTRSFDLDQFPDVAIVGTDERFPVGRIFCVGRNYAAHAREMGKDPDREPPFFFTKFPQSLVASGAVVPYPPATSNYHYEAELVIAIGQSGFAVSVDKALDLVFGYATGLDMTRRDLQLAARDQGRPWDTGKNFARSAPLGLIHPVALVGHLRSGAIRLTVNGAVKQNGDLSELIWDCAEIVSYLSALEPLQLGDLIYTGTPAGVGPVEIGDRIAVEIDALTKLEITIGEPEFV